MPPAGEKRQYGTEKAKLTAGKTAGRKEGGPSGAIDGRGFTMPSKKGPHSGPFYFMRELRR